MENRFRLKYQRILEIISNVAECTGNKLILVGGTAISLFYLNHRVSVDLDFVPIDGDETELKQELKGCLTKKGLRTSVGLYRNQFVVQFEDTTIKVELFSSDYKIKNILEKEIMGKKMLIASLEDLLNMKIIAYSERKKPRDLYDIIAILISRKMTLDSAIELVKEKGFPVESDELDYLAIDENILNKFKEVIQNASKTSNNV
ncbi:nucleotidyl transferase AbiEii/AbiGii toxin family protein [Candidatus Micrarchaeota archaeon]|nr:nucleotidyl transferase AbiEii/AbiGii toxin family protein [Candidatus Micrarchaeota archaeon]